MIDWQSPAELRTESTAFIDLIHGLFGLYVWEFCNTLDLEWDIITKKKRFRWPLTFYFGGRYSLLIFFIGMVIALDTAHPINCQAIYTFNALVGSSSIGFASINLAIRTIAVWLQNRFIMITLVILILGHWAIIFDSSFILADWNPEFSSCVATHVSNASATAVYIYSMAFDATVLGLNAYKLLRNGLALKRVTRTDTANEISRLIFADGLIYFIVAFLSNLLATVFIVLNLSSLMNVMFRIPACVASTIAASRAVRRLSYFGTQNSHPLETQISPFGNHGRHGHVPTIGLSPTIRPGLVTTDVNGASEVHVKIGKYLHNDEMLGGEALDHEGQKWKSVV